MAERDEDRSGPVLGDVLEDAEVEELYDMIRTLGSKPSPFVLAAILGHDQCHEMLEFIQAMWFPSDAASEHVSEPRAETYEDRMAMAELHSTDALDQELAEAEERLNAVMAMERKFVRECGLAPIRILDIDRMGAQQLRQLLEAKGERLFALTTVKHHQSLGMTERSLDEKIISDFRRKLREVWASEVPDDDA